MYQNIFITGATGVVGKPLLKKLLKENHNVFGLSRNEENVKYLNSINVKVIKGNLFSNDLFDQLKDSKIDAIFHIAGVNKMCMKKPDEMFKSNIDGTKKIIELGNQLKVKKFIYTSSAVTLGENLGSIGNESAQHRGYFLSKYEESKYLAEELAFRHPKDFEFVSINPSSVQGPGRVSGTAKLLISTLNKKYPLLIKNNISIVDIDDCTTGHYNGLLFGKDMNRYVLNSFQTSSSDLISALKRIFEWNGTPIYIPKTGLKIIAPIGNLIQLLSSSPPLICSESVRVLTHGHIYDGSKAKSELNLQYTNLDEFMKKTINWLIDNKYIKLKKI